MNALSASCFCFKNVSSFVVIVSMLEKISLLDRYNYCVVFYFLLVGLLGGFSSISDIYESWLMDLKVYDFYDVNLVEDLRIDGFIGSKRYVLLLLMSLIGFSSISLRSSFSYSCITLLYIISGWTSPNKSCISFYYDLLRGGSGFDNCSATVSCINWLYDCYCFS